MSTSLLRILPLSLAVAACLAGASPAGAAASVARQPAAPALSLGGEIARLGPPIRIAIGKSTLRQLNRPLAQIAVNDPKVAGARLLGTSSQLFVWGVAPGSTNLILWDKNQQPVIVDIEVDIDVDGLQAQLQQAFPGETQVKASAAGGAIVLSGMVSDSVKASQILAMASAYAHRGSGSGGEGASAAAATTATAPASAGVQVINMLSVAAPQQVMLEVKIAEVSKTLVDQLGASVGLSGVTGNWSYGLLSNLLSGNASQIGAVQGNNGNHLTLDAQKRDGLVKVLAEPNIMAISGQEASFLAGGKIFIPVAQDSTTNKITLEEKEFGIAVKFTPTVLEGGRINLKVAPEVSELNREGIGISAGGAGTAGSAVLPAFTTRRTTTTVQLFDGQSFAVGGLIKNNVTTNIKALPFLGEIPVLGALFRSSDFQTDRTELVFIITPHLVKPLPGAPVLPTDAYVAPSRSEFFLQGKMEGRANVPPQPGTPSNGAMIEQE
ncbi:type II and III secretion system protein family protein [Janthinobacterium aquaticum]|uniref:type II and III secretion system protein family protein n=1 Tax=Janthinobacterium sp. FT58W TaxID=2654254 RepID=UPI0012655DF5|nr:type II and III secretion system protein family protein [Janthinobacterium sp. FT58W]KAB8042816.1 type II and III secretion system protein family protein [Janthinobacterium sp. FT58W]